MTELDATEIMYAEIKTPMNLNKTAQIGACRNNDLYGNRLKIKFSWGDFFHYKPQLCDDTSLHYGKGASPFKNLKG